MMIPEVPLGAHGRRAGLRRDRPRHLRPGLRAWSIGSRPYHLWKEIVDEKNSALAIVVGAMAIGISIIISAAIR